MPLASCLLPKSAARPASRRNRISDLGHAAADRLLIKLRFDDDLSAREIAGLVGLPTPFHVYRRLNALLGQLRRVLRQRGIHEAEP